MAVGGIGEDVVHVVNVALDDQGARHAIREGEMRAIDTRAALCVDEGVRTRYTRMGDSRRSR